MLSVVILSFNRQAALRRTLGELRAQGVLASAQVVVVDNGSSDGSAAMVRAEFESVEVLGLGENLGVAGFNRGVERARGDVLLILDDDAWPDAAALREGLALLEARAGVGAVAFLPKHPSSGAVEWRARGAQGAWPVMGCGNLVRAEAWRRVDGYEGAFFLYRNDTDLALKLLSAGFDVWFDPAWVVWHDSPAAGARKSERWLELATRNWGWLARRHGRGMSMALGMLAGFAWASRLAGLSVSRQRRAARGAWAGVMRAAPLLPRECVRDGRWFSRLVKMQCER